MKITWSDVKEAVYQLMFLPADDRAEYEQALPGAANYALLDLAAQAAPLLAAYRFSQYPQENTIINTDCQGIYVHTQKDLLFRGEVSRAYAFEADGAGTFIVESHKGTEIARITLEGTRKFSLYRGLIESEEPVQLRFTGTYEYRVKNLALYKDAVSAKAEDIQPFCPYLSYDMEELTSAGEAGRFWNFTEGSPVIRLAPNGEEECLSPGDYSILGGKELHLPREQTGEFQINYRRYPKKITPLTPDDEEMDLSPEAAGLMPLYMAWRLYKDEDERMATLYFNEYQNAKSELILTARKPVQKSAQIWEREC